MGPKKSWPGALGCVGGSAGGFQLTAWLSSGPESPPLITEMMGAPCCCWPEAPNESGWLLEKACPPAKCWAPRCRKGAGEASCWKRAGGSGGSVCVGTSCCCCRKWPPPPNWSLCEGRLPLALGRQKSCGLPANCCCWATSAGPPPSSRRPSAWLCSAPTEGAASGAGWLKSKRRPLASGCPKSWACCPRDCCCCPRDCCWPANCCWAGNCGGNCA